MGDQGFCNTNPSRRSPANHGHCGEGGCWHCRSSQKASTIVARFMKRFFFSDRFTIIAGAQLPKQQSNLGSRGRRHLIDSMILTKIFGLIMDMKRALTDRGIAQAVGIVSDVGTFLPLLADGLELLEFNR